MTTKSIIQDYMRAALKRAVPERLEDSVIGATIPEFPGLIAFGVVASFCLIRWLQVDFFERLEAMTYDMRAREALNFRAVAATNLGFVFINEASVEAVAGGKLGYRYGLYWPRQVYGRLVQELTAQGVKAIAFDILFGELRSDHPPVQMADGRFVESDEFFALQMQQASNYI